MVAILTFFGFQSVRVNFPVFVRHQHVCLVGVYDGTKFHGLFASFGEFQGVKRRKKNQQASESLREKCNAQTPLRENLPPSPALRGRRGIGENETGIFPNATLPGWILARLCVFRTLNVNVFS